MRLDPLAMPSPSPGDERLPTSPPASVPIRRRLTVEIGAELHKRLRLRALQDGETLASMVAAILHETMDHWDQHQSNPKRDSHPNGIRTQRNPEGTSSPF